MTLVSLEKSENGRTVGFTCSGHVGFTRSKFGKSKIDPVCLAVSTLVFHTMNGLSELAGAQLQEAENEKEGFLHCQLTSEPDDRTQLLLDNFELSLRQLSKQYGDRYLQVECRSARK